jgi:hypothetical protein
VENEQVLVGEREVATDDPRLRSKRLRPLPAEISLLHFVNGASARKVLNIQTLRLSSAVPFGLMS